MYCSYLGKKKRKTFIVKRKVGGRQDKMSVGFAGLLEELENLNFKEQDVDRYRSAVLMNYTIHNIRGLMEKEWQSPQSFFVQGLEWNVIAKFSDEGRYSGNVLGLFVQYIGGADISRPIMDVELELVLFNEKDNTSIVKEYNVSFDTNTETRIGAPRCIFWEDVIHPGRGYLRNGGINIQVYMAAAAPRQKIDLLSVNTVIPNKTDKKKKLIKVQNDWQYDEAEETLEEEYLESYWRDANSFSTKEGGDLQVAGSSIGLPNSGISHKYLQSQQFSSLVVDRAQSLLDSGIGSDCEFLVSDGKESKSYRASKILLAKYSEAFERMFFGSFVEDDPIEVEGVKPAVFYQMLKYTYGCNWSFESTENAKDLYYLADRYLMDDLRKICLDYLWPKDVNSVWSAFDLAIQADLCDVKTAAIKIICENTQEVFNSKDFLKLNQISLITILEQTKLEVTSEEEVFNAAVKWATAQCDSKGFAATGAGVRQELDRGIKYIRFLTIPLEKLTGEIYDSGVLTAEEILSIVRASFDRKKYFPPSNLCPLRKPRENVEDKSGDKEFASYGGNIADEYNQHRRRRHRMF